MVEIAKLASKMGWNEEGNALLKIFVLLTTILYLIPNVDATFCLNGTHVELIDDEKYICCNGIYDKTDKHGLVQECCEMTDESGKFVKSEVFSPRKQICCGGKLINLHISRNPSSPSLQCCGHDYFSPDHHICCNNKTYSNSKYYCNSYDCGEVVVGIDDEVSCRYRTPEGRSCSKIHKSRDGFRCCGPDLMKEATHYCFNDQPWPLEVVAATCGDVSYDTAKNICCEGQDDTESLVPMPKEMDNNIKYLGTTSAYSCLAGKIINTDLEHIAIVENRKQIIPNHYLPCGNKFYDPHNKRTQVDCCEGVVNHAHPKMNVTCCGNEFIDLNIYNCCNNTKIETHMMCCGRNQHYSRNSGLECCGSQLINNSYLCCQQQSQMWKPIRKDRGHDTCCGQNTYNSHSKNICCAGEIIEVEQNQTCIHGHIVEFNEIDPKRLKETVNEESQASQKKERNFEVDPRLQDCLPCKTFNAPPKNCVKKFEYQLYIRDITMKGKRTSIDVLFLEPYQLRSTKLTLTTNGRCRCFEKDELYLLQTSRNILDKVTIRKNKLRFSKRDVFRIIKGEFPKYKVQGQKCKIDRFYRKSVKST